MLIDIIYFLSRTWSWTFGHRLWLVSVKLDFLLRMQAIIWWDHFRRKWDQSWEINTSCSKANLTRIHITTWKILLLKKKKFWLGFAPVITTPLLAEWLVLPKHMILIQNYLNNVLKIAKLNELNTGDQSQTECWRSHTINRRKEKSKRKQGQRKSQNVFL